LDAIIIYPLKYYKNVSSVEPREGEKLIIQEDCAEDNFKNGILTLTNQRIIFEKTEGTLATLSKKPGELLLDLPLDQISQYKAEGLLIKKFVVTTKQNEIYKFGVFSNSKWVKEINKVKT
jgi:hypothetical protein